MVDDGRTTDGRTTEHGYTISSPCEPDGSGELKMLCFRFHHKFSIGSVGRLFFFSLGKSGSVGFFFFFFFDQTFFLPHI